MPKDSRASATRVTKAVIPAAGRGTRMAAIAGGRAKELLPVGGRALLAHALADLERSGLAEVLIVRSPEKRELETIFGRRFGELALDYAVQPTPLGLADALSLARPFVRDESFLCWLPDNLWLGREPAAAQLLAALAPHPAEHGVALVERPRADWEAGAIGAAGFFDYAPDAIAGDRAQPIARVHPKGHRPILSGDRLVKGFPFDLWRPDLFARIERLRSLGRPGELDDTPLLQELALEGKLRGVVLCGGTLHDCGVPNGYAAACAAAST